MVAAATPAAVTPMANQIRKSNHNFRLMISNST